MGRVTEQDTKPQSNQRVKGIGASNTVGKVRLFPKEHARNWFVHRPQSVRKALGNLWGNGPDDKYTMTGATIDQKAAYAANLIFYQLEIHGTEYVASHVGMRKDTKHGQCNRQDDFLGLNSGSNKQAKYLGYAEVGRAYNRQIKGEEHENDLIPCVSDGLYHVHLNDAKAGATYVMLFQIFREQKLIVIISIQKHENFNFAHQHDSIKTMMDGMRVAIDKGFYSKPHAVSKKSGGKEKQSFFKKNKGRATEYTPKPNKDINPTA